MRPRKNKDFFVSKRVIVVPVVLRESTVTGVRGFWVSRLAVFLARFFFLKTCSPF